MFAYSALKRRWVAAVSLLIAVLSFRSLWISSKVLEDVEEISSTVTTNDVPNNGAMVGLKKTLRTPCTYIDSSARSTSREEPVNIVVLVDLRAGWRDWGFSFLEANQLQLYGRYNYSVQWLDFTKNTTLLRNLANTSRHCVLVSNPKGLEQIRQDHACHCYTWIINDEFCQYSGDIRHYYNEKAPEQLFLPLGPRYDFYYAHQQAGYEMLPHGNSKGKKVLPTSQRSYIFNAMFSKSTSPSRKELKAMLLNMSVDEQEEDNSNNHTNNKNNSSSEYFIRIPGKWRRKMGPWHTPSDQYVEILGNSKFTLSPTGHNPECFRLYESIIMGSIPIIVARDDEYKNHACPNALRSLLTFTLRETSATSLPSSLPIPAASGTLSSRLLSAPYLVTLDNWTQLEPTLALLLQQDSVVLDAMQRNMQEWYSEFMTAHVHALEDYIVNDIA